MRLFITCDSYWEAKIDKVLNTLYHTGYKHFFDRQNYGSSLDGVAIVLICQDSSLNLRQRIRFSKKEKTIYLDILLDLNQFLLIDQKQREEIVAGRLIHEVPAIIGKYKLKDFDLPKFEADFRAWASKIL